MQASNGTLNPRRHGMLCFLSAIATLFLLVPSIHAAKVIQKENVNVSRRAHYSGGGCAPSDLVDPSRFVALHNAARRQSRAYDVGWDSDLASFAQCWANRCQFEHSHAEGYGENIACGSGNTYNVATSIDDWWQEWKLWRPGMGFGEATGHFTQMAWKDTRNIGCGVAHCPSAQLGLGGTYSRSIFVVCEYYPAGNVIGRFRGEVSLPAHAIDLTRIAVGNVISHTQQTYNNATRNATRVISNIVPHKKPRPPTQTQPTTTSQQTQNLQYPKQPSSLNQYSDPNQYTNTSTNSTTRHRVIPQANDNSGDGVTSTITTHATVSNTGDYHGGTAGSMQDSFERGKHESEDCAEDGGWFRFFDLGTGGSPRDDWQGNIADWWSKLTRRLGIQDGTDDDNGKREAESAKDDTLVGRSIDDDDGDDPIESRDIDDDLDERDNGATDTYDVNIARDISEKGDIGELVIKRSATMQRRRLSGLSLHGGGAHRRHLNKQPTA